MLTEKTIGLGGEEATRALEEMEGRHEGAIERVGEKVKTGLEASPYFTEEARLAEDLSANARPLYKVAYDAHPGISETDVPALKEIMKTPDGKRAVKIALRLLRNQGKDIGKKDAIGMVRRPSLEFLDYVKRGFDQIINKEERKGSTPLGRTMRDLRRQLRDQLDVIAPEYATARAQYAGDLEVLDAIRDGRTRFKNMQPEELTTMFEEFSVAEKNAYRSGVAQHLLEQIERPTTDANPAQKIIGSTANQKRLRAIFPQPEHFEIFQEALRAEADIFAKEKSMQRVGEQARAKRLGEQKFGFDRLAEKFTIIPVIGRFPVLRWGMRMIQSRPDMTEEQADNILRILRNRDVETIKKQLEETPLKKTGRRGKAAIAGAGVGAALGYLMEDED